MIITTNSDPLAGSDDFSSSDERIVRSPNENPPNLPNMINNSGKTKVHEGRRLLLRQAVASAIPPGSRGQRCATGLLLYVHHVHVLHVRLRGHDGDRDENRDTKRAQKTLSPPRICFSRKCVTRHLTQNEHKKRPPRLESASNENASREICRIRRSWSLTVRHHGRGRPCCDSQSIRGGVLHDGLDSVFSLFVAVCGSFVVRFFKISLPPYRAVGSVCCTYNHYHITTTLGTGRIISGAWIP